MTSQPFAPIIVENQVINWGVFSGIAVGVHKYTKTHISGGERPSSIVEIIVECLIQQYDGEEIPVKLSTLEENFGVIGIMNKEEIRLREGQRISVIGGYTDDKSSNCLIFINHNDKKWYWVNYTNIGNFLDNLGVFGVNLLNKLLYRIESDRWFFVPAILVFVLLSIGKPFDSFPFLVTFLVICIEFPLFIYWKQKVNPSRQLVKLQIAEMVRSLL